MTKVSFHFNWADFMYNYKETADISDRLPELNLKPEYDPHCHFESLPTIADLHFLCERQNLSVVNGFWQNLVSHKIAKSEFPWMNYLKEALSTYDMRAVVDLALRQGRDPRPIIEGIFELSLDKVCTKGAAGFCLRSSPNNLSFFQGVAFDSQYDLNSWKVSLPTVWEYFEGLERVIKKLPGAVSVREVAFSQQTRLARTFTIRRDQAEGILLLNEAHGKLSQNGLEYMLMVKKLYERCLIDFLDIAGDESVRRLSDYSSLFAYCKDNNLPVIVHAGEMAKKYKTLGRDNLVTALDFKVLSIGHAVRAFDKGHEDILRRIITEKIPIELNFTSNYLTGVTEADELHPVVLALCGEHSLFKRDKEMLDKFRQLVSVSTDSRSITTISQEFLKIRDQLRQIYRVVESEPDTAEIWHILEFLQANSANHPIFNYHKKNSSMV